MRSNESDTNKTSHHFFPIILYYQLFVVTWIAFSGWFLFSFYLIPEELTTLQLTGLFSGLFLLSSLIFGVLLRIFKKRNTIDTICLVSAEGTLLDGLTRDGEKLSIIPEELTGKQVSDIFPDDLSEKLLRSIQMASETGKFSRVEYKLSNENKKMSLEAKFLSRDKQEVLVILRNVADLKRIRGAGEDNRVTLTTDNSELSIHPTIAMINNLFTMHPHTLEKKEVDSLRKMANNLMASIRTIRKSLKTQHTDKRNDRMITVIEKQLRHTRKLEAIGTLAGGIAHDFNNQLFAILGYLTLAKKELKPGDPILEDLENANEAAKKAQELVNHILAFSRQQEIDPHPVEMVSLVKEASKLIQLGTPPNIVIKQDIDPNCGMVLADPIRIHQVLVNLCANSIHAMQKKGGILEIKLFQSSLSPGEASLNELDSERNYLTLSVKDNGHGIPDTIIDRIFDPFFTTKPVDEGTGLGLSVIHGIIKNHNGNIHVVSNPEEGTTFTVYLPTLEESLPDQLPTEQLPLTGSEKILIVDDEPTLSSLMGRFLKQYSYQTTCLNDSRKALELLEKNPNHFDLIITDHSMPYLTGLQLSRKVLKLRPEIPIILVSGYSHAVSPEKAKAEGVREFIFKPFDQKQLCQTVREVLDHSC